VIGTIVKGINPDGSHLKASQLIKALVDYAKTIEPWAKSVANLMVAEVARRDREMWRKNSREIRQGLRREIENTPTGDVWAKLQDEQVQLIKSLPLQAAQRVHDLAEKAMLDGTRAKEIAAEILDTQNVTAARARLIARTEVARATSNFLQARAEFAGSEGYIWRTSTDSDVRESHAEMEGKYVRWSEPPTLDNLRGHAGTLPNCRCFAEPIFPNDEYSG